MLSRLVITCLWLSAFGCGRQPPAAPAVQSAASEQTNAEPAEADPAAMAAVLNDLTQTVRRFAAEQRRAPKSLDELVSGGYLTSVPPAPAGRRFAINKKLEVVLAR